MIVMDLVLVQLRVFAQQTYSVLSIDLNLYKKEVP